MIKQCQQCGGLFATGPGPESFGGTPCHCQYPTDLATKPVSEAQACPNRIELRWLERQTAGGDWDIRERVLQYRTKTTEFQEWREWSDWTDVPMVIENGAKERGEP